MSYLAHYLSWAPLAEMQGADFLLQTHRQVAKALVEAGFETSPELEGLLFTYPHMLPFMLAQQSLIGASNAFYEQ